MTIINLKINNNHTIWVFKNPRDAGGYKYFGIYNKRSDNQELNTISEKALLTPFLSTLFSSSSKDAVFSLGEPFIQLNKSEGKDGIVKR